MGRKPAAKKTETSQPQQPARQPAQSAGQEPSSLQLMRQLQSTIGNQAVQKLLRSGAIQAKLKIGQPGDVYEQEADRMAEQVMRMPEAQLQRACACGGGCSRCRNEQTVHKHLQMARVRAEDARGMVAPPIIHEVLRSSGQPLSPTTRTFFEPRFGYDFSKVRVHADSRASEAAQAVGAKAFTVGQDTVFGLGQYNPDSNEGRQLLAHELTHVVQQSGNEAMLQRAETDTIPGCAALTDSQADVDARVNASLAAARATAGTPPAGRAVAQNVENDLGRNAATGRTAIEVWASTLPPTKASQPAQSATKYAGVTYRLWSNPLFPILNPTMKINGICVGSDKLGHFFQQGADFRRTEASSGRSAAEEESERSEGGGFGLSTTGVFSNADMEANRQGGRFYNDLIATPTMTFAIARYISSRWSEVDNPNFYEASVGQQVWANTLTGSWTGTSWAGVPFVDEALSVTLAATATGTVTGTFRVGAGAPAVGTIRGTIRYNTTTVRGTFLGVSTSPTPISSIHIEFDWSWGSDTGKGFLDSRGERHLVGRWGRGVSNTDRGEWDISHT